MPDVYKRNETFKTMGARHVCEIKCSLIKTMAMDIEMNIAKALVDLGWTPPNDIAEKLKVIDHGK